MSLTDVSLVAVVYGGLEPPTVAATFHLCLWFCGFMVVSEPGSAIAIWVVRFLRSRDKLPPESDMETCTRFDWLVYFGTEEKGAPNGKMKKYPVNCASNGQEFLVNKPAVVALGPYHHNQPELAQAENYKHITLEEFRAGCRKTIGYLYNKVSEVVDDARKCYIDGSTDGYNDEEFTRMMLLDACFVLFFIECISVTNQLKLIGNEHLGALGVAKVTRDIFLLENQIPFLVLEVLLDMRFNDKGENLLNGFFNYLNYGEVIIRRDDKVLGTSTRRPLHLLEFYRSYFISISASFSSTIYSLWSGGSFAISSKENDNVQPNGPFASITELKAKGIFLKRSSNYDDIKFVSHCCYGELELAGRAVSSNSKAIYMNMIAYEMCAHNPNDFRISTYIRVMKSLVIQREDVTELKRKNILRHSLCSDEEVVKMYNEIEAPENNLYMLNQLRQGIEEHCNRKFKTWAGELVSLYFSSPWKMVALLVATAILFTTFLQTYFTISPLPDASNPLPKHA
ncbi:UPF0481 protein At3g47200-like [Bidens hawaiensis]|uniref:UPF0481 protein At3g47200-like n=1 Tax=Bidens hawaiensis TaxID=980011 RepID=UPI00404AF02D